MECLMLVCQQSEDAVYLLVRHPFFMHVIILFHLMAGAAAAAVLILTAAAMNVVAIVVMAAAHIRIVGKLSPEERRNCRICIICHTAIQLENFLQRW